MNLSFHWILICSLLIKTNQTISNKEMENGNNSTKSVKKDEMNLDKIGINSTKTMILNMNIIGNNIELNFDQNNKKNSVNSSANMSNPKEVREKYSTQIGLGSHLNYPDYLLEVEPPNSSQIFSRRIGKRSEDLNSVNIEKDIKNYNLSKYLELSVFVDFKAYKNLQTNGLIETDSQLHELILCYTNQIQAIYSHNSFEQNFFIHLVKIEIQKTDIFSKTDGNRDELLKQFCEYQTDLNPTSDSDPKHWDMALLLTGYDLYVVRDDGKRDYKSLGLGSVSGICTLQRNCVISEFEAISTGELWPSSGLMSTWAAAHEMAHNLGILHDGWPFNIECPSNGFLMSGSRGTRGETNWSKCSVINFRQSYTDCLNDKQIVRNERYDHNKYKSRPGALWDSDIQCKLFLRDNKAFEFPKTKARICNETILCATPNRIGFYSSGPALEGTNCGDNKWCIDGLCQPKSLFKDNTN